MVRRFTKKVCTFVCTLQIAGICLSSMAFGAVYTDVPSTHWAYASVESIHAKGYLRDFTSSTFNPDGYIDKFTISKILANVAGFSDGDYSAQNAIISKYSAKFSKWNTESNNQIAFLLSKNILTESDLDTFMLFSDDASEKFRAISREEIAVFLVRLMGKTSEADALKNANYFKDDSSITEDRKGAINYLKSINVMSGGSDGLCHPKNAVTRAEFCVLLNNVTEVLSPTVNNASGNNQNNTAQTDNSTQVNNVSSVDGVVTDVYKNLNLVQIKKGDEITTYRLSANVKITLEKEAGSIESIQSGLYASAVINNSEIIELSLLKENPNKTEDNSNTDTKPDSTQNNNTQNNNTQNNTSSEIALSEDSSASGIITSLKIEQSLKNECLIGITTKDGDVKYFSSTRYTVPIYSLKIGDSVYVTANEGRIKTLKFVSKNDKNVKIGYLTDITDDEITIKNDQADEEEFYYDKDITECFDCTTGKKIDFDDLKKYTEVYVLYEDENTKTIDVIFVLDNL